MRKIDHYSHTEHDLPSVYCCDINARYTVRAAKCDKQLLKNPCRTRTDAGLKVVSVVFVA